VTSRHFVLRSLLQFIPMAALSKASVCRRSLAGTAVSNPAGGHGYLSLVNVVCCTCRSPYDGPIPRLEELVPPSVCVIECDQLRQ
jgi:hypothetical protein